MTSDPQPKRIRVYQSKSNGRMLFVAYSRVANYGSELDGPHLEVGRDGAAAKAVGDAARATFKNCRVGIPASKYSDPPTRDTLRLWGAVGARTWGGFDRAVKAITIVDDGEALHLQPKRNGGPGVGYVDIEEKVVTLPRKCSPTALGRAILQALDDSTYFGE